MARRDMPLLHPGWNPGRRQRDRRRRPRAAALLPLLAGVLALVLVALLPFWRAPGPESPGREPAFPAEAYTTPPAPAEAPTPSGDPDWDAGSPQVPAPTLPSPVRPAVVAAATVEAPECHLEDLAILTHGWTSWLGANGATTLTATNRGTAPCLLGGWAELRLAQGGRPLALTMQQLTTTPDHREAPPRRLLLAPGTSASSTLWWRGYGAAADQRTPQRLTVRLGGAERRIVPLPGDGTTTPGPNDPTSPAPFDLVDGGTISLTAWQPAAR